MKLRGSAEHAGISYQQEKAENNAQKLTDPDGRRSIKRIHAEVFNDHSAAGIQEYVKEENITAIPEPFSAGDHQEDKDEEIPERFIEEGGHMPLKTTFPLDLDAKGEKTECRVADRKPISFLVKIIPPAAERLSQDQTGSNDVTQGKERNLLYPAENPRSKKACNYSTINGNTAFPDPQDGNKVIFKLRPGKGDIIDAGTDNTAGQCNQCKIDACILGKAGTFFFF